MQFNSTAVHNCDSHVLNLFTIAS